MERYTRPFLSRHRRELVSNRVVSLRVSKELRNRKVMWPLSLRRHVSERGVDNARMDRRRRSRPGHTYGWGVLSAREISQLHLGVYHWGLNSDVDAKGYAEVTGRFWKCPSERDTGNFLDKCNGTNLIYCACSCHIRLGHPIGVGEWCEAIEHSSCETIPKPGYASEPEEFGSQGWSRDGSERVDCEKYMQKGKQSLHSEKRVGRGESGG
jgi:hypothetical protein